MLPLLLVRRLRRATLTRPWETCPLAETLRQLVRQTDTMTIIVTCQSASDRRAARLRQITGRCPC